MAHNPHMDILLDPMAYIINQHRPHPDPKRFNHSWRIDMLAIPKGHTEEMYLFSLSPTEAERYKKIKAEKHETESLGSKKRYARTVRKLLCDHLPERCLRSVRVYNTTKNQWKKLLGKKFEKTMKDLADAAKQSMYHEYDRARAKLKKSAKSRGKSKGKKTKKRPKRKPAEIRAAALGNVDKMATPKQIIKPPKIDRGKHGNVDMARIDRLRRPKSYTPKFVDDSKTAWRHMHFVSLNAMKYTPTPRIQELAAHKVHLVEPPPILGVVVSAALLAKASPRVLELAVPKTRNAVQEADNNEDAFKVSPNALHYKATERITNLAKPKVRD